MSITLQDMVERCAGIGPDGHPPATMHPEPVLLNQPQPPECKSLADLKRREADDPTELLRTGYLCRGGGLLLCGPTGIGKSAFAMQAMLLWGMGRECFGIVPVRPLKSLLIQAENDDGDLAEMRDGVIAGLELPGTLTSTSFASMADRWRSTIESDQPGTLTATAPANIVVACEDTRTGAAFATFTLAPLLEKHRPDLVWIDPALAYLGGEASAQKDVGGFLRNQINPLLHQFECGGIIITHTNKPPSGKEKPTWQAGDFAYSGTGSAEWANWARAVLALRSIGSHDVFELRAGKRGARLGWQDADGQRSYVRHLAHSTKGICWRDAASSEVPKTGRSKDYDAGELLTLLPPEGLTSSEWRDEAAKEYGIKERSFYGLIKTLQTQEKVLRSKVNKRWQPILK
jgi:hypothetical protein